MENNKLTAQLRKIGKTHQWLADRLNATPGTIARWMLGQRPNNYATMRHTADLLRCRVSDIWEGVYEPVDWQRRLEVLSSLLRNVNGMTHPAEYRRLCGEISTASVHLYVAIRRSAPRASLNDCTPNYTILNF